MSEHECNEVEVVAEKLINEIARLNTLLNHISYLSTLVQHDIEKANNVLLAIHETAAGKITTEEDE